MEGGASSGAAAEHSGASAEVDALRVPTEACQTAGMAAAVRAGKTLITEVTDSTSTEDGDPDCHRMPTNLQRPKPVVSVILPVYDAMPWLTIAVRDMLKQQLPRNASLELLVAYDGGGDGSLDFLLELVAALGQQGADEVVSDADSDAGRSEPALNPALARPLRAPEHEDHPSFGSAGDQPQREPLSVAEVVATARPEHGLRLLRHADGRNRGQGAAMSLAYSRAAADIIAQMESDDERADPTAFAQMLRALEEHADWDGVSCNIELIGWERPGMQAYAAWQNRQATPAQMAAGRFIEIPALHQVGAQPRSPNTNPNPNPNPNPNLNPNHNPDPHQTSMFRRLAVERVLQATGGTYRDGPHHAEGQRHAGRQVVLDAGPMSAALQLPATDRQGGAHAAELDGDVIDEEVGHGNALDAPVDMWWWLSFFHLGLRCGKVGGAPLFGWRQHPRQHTRTHGRLALDNLRRIKAHFLVCEGGRLGGCARIIVISVGATLEGWARELRAHPRCCGVPVIEVSWAPGKKGNAPLPPTARLQPDESTRPSGKSKRKYREVDARLEAGIAGDEEGVEHRGAPSAQSSEEVRKTVRVWAYGRDKVRNKIREGVPDFDEAANDVFVA